MVSATPVAAGAGDRGIAVEPDVGVVDPDQLDVVVAHGDDGARVVEVGPATAAEPVDEGLDRQVGALDLRTSACRRVRYRPGFLGTGPK